MQHIHYAFRGDTLIDFSLYEYAASIVIVPKAKKKDATTVNDTDNDEYDIAIPPTHGGRLSNASIEFHPKHPLYQSHCQRIRSKSKIPVNTLSTPGPPSTKPFLLTPEWRKAARVFSRYVLVLFRPWIENGGTIPGPLTWKEFCRFMEILEFSEDGNGPPTDAEIVRRRWIENASQGFVCYLYQSGYYIFFINEGLGGLGEDACACTRIY